MDIPVNWIETLLSIIGAGLIAWNVRIENKTSDNAKLIAAQKESISDLRTELARNYHSKEELRQVLNDVLGSVKDELTRLARAVEAMSDARRNNRE